MRFFTMALLALVACKDKSSDDTAAAVDDSGTDDSGATDDTAEEETYGVFSDFINTTEAATGDFTCYTGTWITETVDSNCLWTVPITEGETEDFASGNKVPGALVEAFHSDAVSGTADLSVTADEDGLFTGDYPVCLPVTVKTSIADGSIMDTVEQHTIHGIGDGVHVTALSVDEGTWLTIPSLFGVPIDDDKGVIAGQAHDCNEDVIVGAQVVVVDSAGNIPGDERIGYTAGGIPNRSLTATSDDGVWIAMNLPPGKYTAEMYVSDGAGGQTLVGSAPVEAFALSVTIASVLYGRTSGYDLPDSCLGCSD